MAALPIQITHNLDAFLYLFHIWRIKNRIWSIRLGADQVNHGDNLVPPDLVPADLKYSSV